MDRFYISESVAGDKHVTLERCFLCLSRPVYMFIDLHEPINLAEPTLNGYRVTIVFVKSQELGSSVLVMQFQANEKIYAVIKSGTAGPTPLSKTTVLPFTSPCLTVSPNSSNRPPST